MDDINTSNEAMEYNSKKTSENIYPMQIKIEKKHDLFLTNFR